MIKKPRFTETVKGSWFHSRNVVVLQKSGKKIQPQFKSDKQTNSLHLKSKITIKAMVKPEKFQENEQIKEVFKTSLSTYISLTYRSPLSVRLRISVMLFLFSDLQGTRINGQIYK